MANDALHSHLPAAWQTALAEAVRSPHELCKLLGLAPALAAEAERAAVGFPLLVPRPFLARIRPGDPYDPLLRQVLPRLAELTPKAGFQADPLGEARAACGPGLLPLLQKYHGRTLIVATGACAVHCRYCFRRHFPYEKSSPGPGNRSQGGEEGDRFGGADIPVCHGDQDSLGRKECLPHHGEKCGHGEKYGLETALRRIAADPSVHEVILSGGDPLTLPDAELAQFATKLAEIPHLRRLRIHTRLPIMIPQRVTGELVSWLRGGRLSPVVVVQVNHPAEIDRAVADALGRLVDAGVPVLNQAVLLRAVNDRGDVLAELCERLADLRVMPYYLHQLDPVAGAADFETSIETGRELIAALRARLPGYAVPRYVRETPGGLSKEVLA